METSLLVIAILVAVLIAACGVWVAVVLIATVTRVPRPERHDDDKSPS
jgi:hypothetical protein